MNEDVDFTCEETFNVEDEHTETKISPELQNLHITNKEGHTPLMIAIKRGDLAKVKQIIAKDKTTLLNTTRHGTTVFVQAVKSKNQNILKALLNRLLSLRNKDIAKCYYAMDRKQDTCMTHWIKTEQEADAELQELLERVSTIADLVQQQKFRNVHKQKLASDLPHLKLKFQENINNPNAAGDTPLIEMIKSNNVSMIPWLLDQSNMDLSLKDKNGDNALMVAASTYNPLYLKPLLMYLKGLKNKKVADLYNQSDMDENTSLKEYWYAAAKNKYSSDKEMESLFTYVENIAHSPGFRDTSLEDSLAQTQSPINIAEAAIKRQLIYNKLKNSLDGFSTDLEAPKKTPNPPLPADTQSTASFPASLADGGPPFVSFTAQVHIRFYNKEDEPVEESKTPKEEVLENMKQTSNHQLAELPKKRKRS